MAPICNNSAAGSDFGGIAPAEFAGPMSDTMRALRKGRASMELKASDALTFLLSGRAESLIWAGETLALARAGVTAFLNAGALVAAASFGIGVWALGWWAFAAIPLLGGFYVLWAQLRYSVRNVTAMALVLGNVGAAFVMRGHGAELAWISSVVVACLLLQAVHVIAFSQVRQIVLSSEKALEGLQRKGIVKVTPIA